MRFSGLTKGVMLLLIGCKTGGQFEFKSGDFPLSHVRWRVNCLAPPCDSGRQEHPSAGLFILFAD